MRPVESLASTLPSIMAVTFTVKATDEMKSRIVENLAALSSAKDITDPDVLKKIDYLEDFEKEFHATKDEIADVARHALRILLLHYSDFRVSTIDTFFQSILHTFAYEVNLDDTFNLEIDSNYVATMGLNATLDTLAAARSNSSDLLYWIKQLMTDMAGGNNWNLFQRNEKEGSLYSTLIDRTSELEKEKFKMIRDDVEEYFDTLPRSFRDIVKDFDDANISDWKAIHDRRRIVAQKFCEAMSDMDLQLTDMYGGKSKASYIENALRDFDPFNPHIKHWELSGEPGCSLKGDVQTAIKQGKNRVVRSLDNPLVAEADRLLMEFNSLGSQLADMEPQMKLWKAYRQMLPYLRVVIEISRLKREYLEATNSFEISDTNSILKRIIGDNETPFIYERMGNIIRHFLIDEFQDTSRMQWDNFYPLLKESVDNYNDNLIIGDAKQSIYRFRNADSSLITSEVERRFTDRVITSAEDYIKDPAQENTNYRSMVNIVDFNNRLFSTLTSGDRPWSAFLKGTGPVYADCRQAVPDKVREMGLGYAEFNFYPSLSDKEKEGFEEVDGISLAQPGLRNLPELILSLKKRGYELKDIGILVRKNKEGKAVVQVLSDHNSQHPEDAIQMISDESLLLKNSAAVRLILYALELAAKGPGNKVKKNDILSEPVKGEELYELLNSLQSMALPSVVEAVVSKFLPRPAPSDIPFIAAFQDAVLDYVSSHSSDIGSFLKWWDKKAESLSISSPEDSDGVRILTVHKAKGLEYRCVIMPMLSYNFRPSSRQKEWSWVRPSHTLKAFDTLPPYIPVENTSSLEGTVHEDIYRDFLAANALDILNSVYVAFTRAEDELYVFGELNKKQADSRVPHILSEMMAEMDDVAKEPFRYNIGNREEAAEEEGPEGEEKIDGKSGGTFSYGRPLTEVEIESQKSKEREKSKARIQKTILSMPDYKTYFGNELLQIKEDKTTPGMVSKEDEEAESEDLDPRSEGNRKHLLLEMIKTEDDLDKALRKMLVMGKITAKESDVWREMMRDALASVREKGWFDPANRVLNERTIIQYREANRRPDRVVVRPDGTAVIIDYKFGVSRTKDVEQVRGYRAALLQSGLFPAVEAYLWYVSEGKIVEVE